MSHSSSARQLRTAEPASCAGEKRPGERAAVKERSRPRLWPHTAAARRFHVSARYCQTGEERVHPCLWPTTYASTGCSGGDSGKAPGRGTLSCNTCRRDPPVAVRNMDSRISWEGKGRCRPRPGLAARPRSVANSAQTPPTGPLVPPAPPAWAGSSPSYRYLFPLRTQPLTYPTHRALAGPERESVG